MPSLRYFDGIQYGTLKGLTVLVEQSTNALYVTQPSLMQAMGWDDKFDSSKLRSKIKSKSFAEFIAPMSPQQGVMVTSLDKTGRENKMIALPIQTALALVYMEVLKGNQFAADVFDSLPQDLLSMINFAGWKLNNREKMPCKDPESEYQQKVVELWGGDKEVITPVGRIDVLTQTEVIEVKKLKHWKSALGQVLAYGHFYPNLGKRICLYGKACSDTQMTIIKICESQGVKVTFL